MSSSISGILSAEQTESLLKLTESLTKDQLLWTSGYLAGLLSKQNEISGQKTVESKPLIENEPWLTILYGSRTGNEIGRAHV